MLQEINNFMNSLPAELKQAGLKPKEGLHVLLKIQEKEGTHFMDEQSVCRVCLTRKATEFDYPFLQHCAELAQVGWCVNTNKCFDLPAKGLHSCSPYCIALKRESLEGGGKYAKDKTKIYDRIDTYFANALSYVEEDSEKERIRVFQHFINSKEKLYLPVFSQRLMKSRIRSTLFFIWRRRWKNIAGFMKNICRTNYSIPMNTIFR